MLIVAFLSWWYGAGYRARLVIAREQIAAMVDYFSIDLLLRTLFAPFRQISAGKIQGPLPVLFRAWVDRSLSRVIGAVVRTLLLVIGTVAIVGTAIIAGVVLVLWAVIPIVPLLGLLLFLWGWVPSWI